MTVREIKPGVYSVGAVDWDRRLFDELIPLPEGTSYNSYLVRGSAKTALIDTVDPSKEAELIGNLQAAGVGSLDYIVANHAEQDHSGSIPRMLELYPGAKVVANEKAREYLTVLLGIDPGRFQVIKDGDRLDLGGKTLEFIFAPWVHWPETMLTLLVEERILFTCDMFGSHLATSDLYASDEGRVVKSAKRYYAEIMMPFRHIIRNHLQKLKAVVFDVIAPSHGPIYGRPKLILDAYEDWTSDDVKNVVVLAYVSMHGSTAKLVEHLIDALIRRGVAVKPFNLPRTDLGELAIELVDAATIVIATPTVLAGPHPSAVYAAYLANALRPKARYAAVVTSYNWGGRAAEQLAGMLGNLKVELLPSLAFKGLPSKGDYAAVEKLADEIAARHKGL